MYVGAVQMALRDMSALDFRARYRAAGSRRVVEPNGHELENRFGLLGPTRVQIPPPPLSPNAPAPNPVRHYGNIDHCVC